VQAEGFGLVVVDNASDAFGGDEIQRRQVRAFMRALAQIARLTDCAVVLLAHVDKATSRARKAEGGEGYSGSTAWHNSARSRLFLTRAESGALTLEHQKSNLGKLREPLSLVWPDGGLPMLAPSYSDLTERMQGRADDEQAAQLLKMIAEFESRGQYCSPAITSRNHVYAVLKSEPEFQRLKLGSDATKRIVNQCQRAKWIEPLDYRTPDRKPHHRWTLTALGRTFAGLPAPTAPTAPTTEDGASQNMAQASAPTAPTGVGVWG
jgi:putative DNA primase/helicase